MRTPFLHGLIRRGLLGIGIPLTALAAFGIGAWWLLRRVLKWDKLSPAAP